LKTPCTLPALPWKKASCRRRRGPAARRATQGLKGDNADQDAGIKIVLRAIEARCARSSNAGDEPSVVVNKAEGKGNFGYNAANGTYGDMVEMGVLDPTKVTRTALQNAASVAGLMLTTDAWSPKWPKTSRPACPAWAAWAAWAAWGM
jgi:chaperonin GroEL